MNITIYKNTAPMFYINFYSLFFYLSIFSEIKHGDPLVGGDVLSEAVGSYCFWPLCVPDVVLLKYLMSFIQPLYFCVFTVTCKPSAVP